MNKKLLLLCCDELLPMSSRMHTRLAMDYADRTELIACMKQLLVTAGNLSLTSSEWVPFLCDHAAGNYRVLRTMAAELLTVALRNDITQLTANP